MNHLITAMPRMMLAGSILLLTALPDILQAETILSWQGSDVDQQTYMRKLANRYQQHNGTKFRIEAGQDTEILQNVASQKIDLGGTSRRNKFNNSRESGVKMVPLAWSALAVIVHKDNSLTDLSLQQLRDIYLGKISNWRQLGGPELPIRPMLLRNRTTGIGSAIHQLVFGGATIPVTGVILRDSTAALESAIQQSPASIAITDASSTHRSDIKVLAVDGSKPHYSSIKSGQYPLGRPLYLAMNLANPRYPEIKRFLKFVHGSAGRQILKNAGLVPYLEAVGLSSRQNERQQAAHEWARHYERTIAQQIRQRQALRKKPSTDARVQVTRTAKPVTRPAVPEKTTRTLSVASLHRELLTRTWFDRQGPTTLLPSDIVHCKDRGTQLVCLSETIDTRLDGQAVRQRRQTRITGRDDNHFTVSYRTETLAGDEALESGNDLNGSSSLALGWEQQTHELECSLADDFRAVQCQGQQSSLTFADTPFVVADVKPLSATTAVEDSLGKILLAAAWFDRQGPATLLPSSVVHCRERDQQLLCLSDILTLAENNKHARQRLQAHIEPIEQGSKDRFTIRYRREILPAASASEDEQIGDVSLQTGWEQQTHRLDCVVHKSLDTVTCQSSKGQTRYSTTPARSANRARNSRNRG